MPRLHRAQTKKLEEMPKEELCCQTAIDFYTQKGLVQVIIDLDTVQTNTVACSYCFSISTRQFVMGTNENGTGLIPMDSIDIDEAPYIPDTTPCPPLN